VARLIDVIKAKVFRRPLALCDGGDFDGISCAAIFLVKYPNGEVVFGGPTDVRRWWVRLIKWDFVADLPCPGKAKVRADHHVTNTPCADEEFYDPEAPCSALMAARALKLEDNDVVKELVRIAIETDTANLESEEARKLDIIARASNYQEKKLVAHVLSREGLKALERPEIKSILERGGRMAKLVEELASKIPVEEHLVIYSPRKLPISYRALTIRLEKRGARLVNVLVRLGYRTYRLYCGAPKEGGYDCTKVAIRLGGGGHRYASGATYKAPILSPSEGFERFIRAVKEYLGVERLRVYTLNTDLSVNWHEV